MDRLDFLKKTSLALLGCQCLNMSPIFKHTDMYKLNKDEISFRLIRNATIVVTINGKAFLVDPMLSPKHVLDPIPWTNETRNPTVDLPFSQAEMQSIIEHCDYVVITHMHPDHWDAEAQKMIPKSKPIICQPEDMVRLEEQGFKNLMAVNKIQLVDNISVERVRAQHGHGELAEKMSPVSGYIITSASKTFYISGDTVWYEGVKQIMEKHKPDVSIINAGGAQFQFGEPITMTAGDVLQVARHSQPHAKTIVVHMEAVNHCALKREDLKKIIAEHHLSASCFVPEDGERIII